MHALASAALTTFALASVALFPAHATVVDATVENGETLTAAPDSFSVTMNEEILQVPGVGTANVLYIQDAEGNYYGDGCVTVEGSTASIETALGESGDYTFSYTVVSSDTHPVSDTYNFTWEAPADFTPATGNATPPECGVEAPAEEPTETEGEAVDETNSDETANTDAEDETVATASDDPAEEDEPGALPGWAFAVISIALVALIIGVIIGNFVKARRQFGDAAPEASEDDKPEDQR